MSKLETRQVHLDFHTPALGEPLAAEFDAKEFAATLLKSNVNSITLFAKDHHGYAFFDTKLGYRHPDLSFDLLSQQVDTCHQANIKAPIYISVGFDDFIGQKNSNWYIKDIQGRPILGRKVTVGPLDAGYKRLCLNSPYVEYLYAQVDEIISYFEGRLDGLFFDIIRQDPCYCSSCMPAMVEAGVNVKDEQAVQNYADRITIKFENELSGFIRNRVANCPIFYNAGAINPSIRDTLYANSHLEIEALASSRWGYGYFPATVRYAKHLGMDYLAMTSKFHFGWADFGSYKNPAALEYETSLALAHGAKISIGDQMYPSGKLQEHSYELIGHSFSRVKKLEAYCYGTTPVSEIAVFYPKLTGEIKIPPSLAGAVSLLNESHYSFEVIDAQMDFAPYKLLILPDDIDLTESLMDKFRHFTKNGGKILSTYHAGLHHSRFIFDDFPVSYQAEGPYETNYVKYENDDWEQVLYHSGVYTLPKENTHVSGTIIEPWFNRTHAHFYSHAHAPAHKETVFPAIASNEQYTYFAHPIFTLYYHTATKAYKTMVTNEIAALMKEEPIVKTNAPSTADIVLNYQAANKRYVLHLLHYVQQRRGLSIDVIEETLPLVNVKFSIRLADKIETITRVSDQKDIPFTQDGDRVVFELAYHEGHDVFLFE